MERYEKGAVISIDTDGAAVLNLKTVGGKAVVLTPEDKFFIFDSSDVAVGIYSCRYLDGHGRCIKMSELEILKPFAEMEDDEDPRSPARRTLDAIDAALAGRATAQQKKVQVGDRTIEYSSLKELAQWRHFYALQVAKEEGVGGSGSFTKKYELSRGR